MSTKIVQETIKYISKALKQASHDATVLHYSPRIDSFLENLAAPTLDHVLYFEESTRDTSKLTAKTWLKIKDRSTFEVFS